MSKTIIFSGHFDLGEKIYQMQMFTVDNAKSHLETLKKENETVDLAVLVGDIGFEDKVFAYIREGIEGVKKIYKNRINECDSQCVLEQLVDKEDRLDEIIDIKIYEKSEGFLKEKAPEIVDKIKKNQELNQDEKAMFNKIMKEYIIPSAIYFGIFELGLRESGSNLFRLQRDGQVFEFNKFPKLYFEKEMRNQVKRRCEGKRKGKKWSELSGFRKEGEEVRINGQQVVNDKGIPICRGIMLALYETLTAEGYGKICQHYKYDNQRSLVSAEQLFESTKDELPHVARRDVEFVDIFYTTGGKMWYDLIKRNPKHQKQHRKTNHAVQTGIIELGDIIKASMRIKPYVQKSPLIRLTDNIYLKLESEHRTVKAFKIRGAFNALLRLIEQGKLKEFYDDNAVDKEQARYVGCVATAAVSSHGFAVGYAGQKLGIHTTCFMPKNAPDDKTELMKRLVTDVYHNGTDFRRTERAGMKFADDLGIPFVHPYNDPDIIAGQGTIGLELYEQMAELGIDTDVNSIYIPVGGGALISGTGIALKSISSMYNVIGVQPELMHAMKTSFDKGKVTPVQDKRSNAAQLCINLNPDTITFRYVQQYVDKFETPNENEIKDAMRMIYEKLGASYLVEPVGAISVAAALKDKNRKGVSVCVVSGGNIDQKRFYEMIR
ncbi:MAG: pyridoxal-phosphate dependent enzyme [Candidatus Woesearchaeota archaeon]